MMDMVGLEVVPLQSRQQYLATLTERCAAATPPSRHAAVDPAAGKRVLASGCWSAADRVSLPGCVARPTATPLRYPTSPITGAMGSIASRRGLTPFCYHQGTVTFDELAAHGARKTTKLLAVKLWLKCTKCGGQYADLQPDWSQRNIGLLR